MPIPPSHPNEKKNENIFAWFPFLSLSFCHNLFIHLSQRDITTTTSSPDFHPNDGYDGFVLFWFQRAGHTTFLLRVSSLSIVYPCIRYKKIKIKIKIGKSHHSKLQNQMTHSKKKRQLTKQNFQNQLNTRNWNESKRNKIER